MGNQVSTASRETVLTATLPVRKVCDQILEMMLKDINVRDFYLMATKQECKRYVIFLANQMSKTFHSLRFAPARGAAGMIFFEPIDLLQKPSPEKQAERQSLCLFLAYFFVRIFQIYGALAITLIDDANVFVKFRGEKGLTEDQRARPFRGSQDQLGTPGAPNPLPGRFDYLLGRTEPLERVGPIYPRKDTRDPLFRLPSEGISSSDRRSEYERPEYGRPEYGRPVYGRPDYTRPDYTRPEYGRRPPYGYVGGGYLSKDKLGKFQFLENRVEDQALSSVRISENLDLRTDIGYPLRGVDASFKLQKDEFRTDTKNANRASLFIKVTASRRLAQFYEVKMEIVEKRSMDDTFLRIVAVRYQSLLDEALAQQRARYGGPRPTFRADLEGSKLQEHMAYIYGGDRGDLPITKELTTYKIGSEDPIAFIKSLKEQIDILLGLKKPSDYRDLSIRDNRIVGEVDEHLDIQNVLVYLQQKKPLANCVTRGLQLLGNRATDGTMESAICRTKFLIGKKEYEDKTVDRTDVPDPGGKLVDMGGIKALSNLFYDTIKFKSNNLVRSHKAMNDYIVFMQKMTNLFAGKEGKGESYKKEFADLSLKGEKEKETYLESSASTKLEEITDDKMKAFCSVLKEDTVIDPKTPLGKSVLKKVTQLFGRQIQHAANCGNIFKQLFTTVSVNGIVSVRINKMVYMKGVLELNRINDLARNLLMKYYESCESLYREGVELLVESKQKQKENTADEPKPKVPEPKAKEPANITNDPRPPTPNTRKGGGTRKYRRTTTA